MKLLLDTCAFLWLAAAPQKLSPTAIDVTRQGTTELIFSDCSVWEICLKWQAGKISLPDPPRTWIETQRTLWQITPQQIRRNDLYRMTELPLHHRDPFDRLLIAQAIDLGLTIATPDSQIARYPVAVLR